MPNKSRSPTRYSGLSSLLGGSAWAIRETKHRQLVSAFNNYLRAGPAGAEKLEQLRAVRETRAAEVGQIQDAAQGIAILTLHGAIVPRGDVMIEYCGAASPHNFADAVSQAMNDAAVSSIVLDIDSGGGAVAGIDVAYEAVRRASLVKPVTAVVNTMCCSAAYWIASAAREIVITPAGEAGSIGVIGTHVDESAALDDMGLKVTYVRSTPGKALGQPTEAMDGAVLDSWQSEVDQIHTLFIEAIALGRNRSAAEVRSTWATGEVWFGQGAVNAGLADRVGTLGDVIGAHMQDAQAQQARQARKGRAASGPLRRMQARVDALHGEKDKSAAQTQSAKLLRDLNLIYLDLDLSEHADFAALQAETAQLHAALLLPPVAPPHPQEEPPMLINLKAADGTVHQIENTEEAVQAFVLAQVDQTRSDASATGSALAQEATEANAAHLSQIGSLFGLTPEQTASRTDLSPWQGAASNAAAVTDHRAAMLAELEQLAVTVDGNTGAAAQIVKLAGAASLVDLTATVCAYRDRRDALIPGRRSVDAEITEEEVKTPARRPNYDRN